MEEISGMDGSILMITIKHYFQKKGKYDDCVHWFKLFNAHACLFDHRVFNPNDEMVFHVFVSLIHRQWLSSMFTYQ